MALKSSGRSTACCVAFLTLFASSCGAKPETGPGIIDPDAPQEFTETASGLKYRILRKSDGARPEPADRVRVDYSGWLDSGVVFDTTYDGQEPRSFQLQQVIQGWTEGLQLIGEGGMIELEVPPELGYGAEGNPTIPPNATLHFKIELLEIES